MVHKHHVEGYENFCEFMENFDSKGKIVHVYFSGSKLPSGESWCDDCVRAWPFIEEALNNADDESHFIYVEVGDRPTWKEPRSSFRIDTRTRLMQLPTLLRWQSPQRLEGDQCENIELVTMLFTDDDED